MHSAEQPIGVFDSGVGGLSVLQALRAELPAERFVYLADSGNAPYGDARGDAFVARRTHAITRYLRENHHIKALVVACNTATAAAIHEIRHSHPDLPLIGLEPALKPAAAHSHTGHIGVIGTRGTLGSSKFRHLLASLADNAHFVVQPCDGLAKAIEDSTAQPFTETSVGDGHHTKMEALCAQYLGAMGPFGHDTGQMDTLVLGCTHYVFATDILRALVGPTVRIIETGEPVARQTRRLLQQGGLLASPAVPPVSGFPAIDTPPSIQLYTTGALAQLQAGAQRWLQIPAAWCSTVVIA